MSDLQCPATMLIARHGEAKRAVDGVLPGDGGALTDKGHGQVRNLAEQVRERRVAAVYASSALAAVESADLAASELGLLPVVIEGLEELAAGDLVVTRFTQAINEMADIHRGETVLVFTHAAAMLQAIPGLSADAAQNPPGPDLANQDLAGPDLARQNLAGSLPHCAVAVVEVNADGWRLVSWPTPRI